MTNYHTRKYESKIHKTDGGTRSQKITPYGTRPNPKRNITQRILHSIAKGRIFLGNTVFRGKNLTKINLSGYRINRPVFVGTNLTEADFTNATLIHANFSGAILTGANFKGVQLRQGVKLDGATLTRAIFDKQFLENANRDMRGIKLIGLDLTDFDFKGADLTGADFTGADLTGAITNERTKLSGAIFVGAKIHKQFLENANPDMKDIKLNGLDLTEFDFTGKSLVRADFTGATLHKAVFSETHDKLRDAIFTGAKLSHARFFDYIPNISNILSQADKDMTGIACIRSKLENAILENVDLTGAILLYTSFKDATLINCKLINAQLSNASFNGATLIDCKLINAQLINASFNGATLSNCDISNENLVENLDNAHFDNAIFTKLKFTDGMFSYIDTDMRNVKLISMDLTNESFSDKTLDGAEFNDVKLGKNLRNLSGVIFTNIISYDPKMFVNANTNMRGISLDKFDLTSVDFSGKDLEGAIFTNTTLTGTKFNNAKLMRAIFTGAKSEKNGFIQNLLDADDMRGIILDGLHLTGVYFSGKDLTGASFYNTTLKNVSFSKNSVLYNSTFNDATLHNVKFNIPKLESVSFVNAKFSLYESEGPFIGENPSMQIRLINFTGADLYKINFRNLAMKYINMTKANLIEAKFSNLSIENSIFTEADLIDAHFDTSLISDTTFSYADLTGANLTGATYTNIPYYHTSRKDMVSGAICNGIIIADYSPVFQWCSTREGILAKPLPEKVVDTIINRNEEHLQAIAITGQNIANEIHNISDFGDNRDKYITIMKSILGTTDRNYTNTEKIIQNFVTAIDSINERDLTMVDVVPNNVSNFVNLNKTQLQNGKIQPVTRDGRIVGYRIPNTKIGLKNRVRHVLGKALADNNDIDKTYFGVTGEFVKLLPKELSNFKTLFLTSFINDTFFSYGNIPMVKGQVDFDAAVDTGINRCQSCVGGIRQQLMRNLMTSIETSCKGNTCGNDIKQIADVLDIKLENQEERDIIQDADMNPILAEWFESIEKDDVIGPSVVLSPIIQEARALSCLKFMKIHLRKLKINYRAELFGYNASIDIKNYMIKHKDYLYNAQLGGKRRHKRTRKLHRK
jgi:uncharacterized protein YjbI with pentapeptide repeats